VDGGGIAGAGGILIGALLASHEDTKMSDLDRLEGHAREAVDCGYRLHRELGPGLLESAYDALMAEALRQRGTRAERQVTVLLQYYGVVVDNVFKIDLLVERLLLIELKLVERIVPVHGKQLLTYLRLMRLPFGPLMNFGGATFKVALRGVANDYYGAIGN